MQSPATEYNQVAYPSAIYSQTHPDRLATIGRLFGVESARVDKSRVLELGCGDGTNLISIASGLPDSRFVGIDLATEPIRRGRETINALGLNNIELQVGDILQADFGATRFDYIIAHGLYAWVPAPVRDRILQICRDYLTPNGIAYISYNAYPGNHLRDLARGMMQYHARNFSDPLQQIRQARGLLKLVAEARPEPQLFHQAVQQEFERCLKYVDAGFYHDDLSAANQPVYFWQFAEHAKSFGLQFLAEVEISDMQPGGLAPHVVEILQQLDPKNIIARQQYLDFFTGRAFRQTLLCGEDIEIERDLRPQHAMGLLVAADVQPQGVNPEGLEDFAGRNGAVIATANAAARSALEHLGKVWPQRIPLSEIARNSAELVEFFLRCYSIGFVDLHTWSPQFVTEVSERPAASLLARYQAAISDGLPTPRHTTLQIEGPIARRLVRLLDGTNDRASLLKQLSPQEPSFDSEVLETILRHLARSGILVA